MAASSLWNERLSFVFKGLVPLSINCLQFYTLCSILFQGWEYMKSFDSLSLFKREASLTKASKAKHKDIYTVQAVNNAMDILELLANSPEELSQEEITAKLGFTKSNVKNLLSNLEHFFYVDRNRYTGNYCLGVKTFQIAQVYTARLNIVASSLSYMQSLKKRFNETVYISTLKNRNISYLHAVEADRAVHIVARTGNTFPAYAVASGKAQLAALPNKEVISLFENTSFIQKTEQTTSNLDSLLKELEKVRERGYALELEEYETEVHSVACNIRNFSGKVIAALSISGPAVRLTKEKIYNNVAPALLLACRQLSKKFGYIDSTEPL